jgi:hypothetical protein
LNEESLMELEKTFRKLQLELKEIDAASIRDKRSDFETMGKNELEQFLKSEIKPKKKVEVLLNQIGYLRINLFSEYYEQIKVAEKEKELDKAARLMDQCAEVIAIPFYSTKKQSEFIKRLKKWLSIQSRPESLELINNWKTEYETWFKPKEPGHSISDSKRLEEFDKLKKTFLTLYTFSFSADNFPQLRERRTDR